MKKLKGKNKWRKLTNLLIMSLSLNLLFNDMQLPRFIKAESIVQEEESQESIEENQDQAVSPGAVRMPVVQPYREQPAITKDKWTEGKDGKWRKIIPIQALDIPNMVPGSPVLLGDTGIVNETFYDQSKVGNVKSQVVEQNGKSVLKFFMPNASFTQNIYCDIDLARLPEIEMDSIEVRMQYTRPKGNIEITKGVAIPFNGECGYLDQDWNNMLPMGTGAHPNGTPALDYSMAIIPPVLNRYHVRIPTYNWTGGSATEIASIERLDFIAVKNKNPDIYPIGKNEWKQGVDGLWRKLIPIPGLDIQAMPPSNAISLLADGTDNTNFYEPDALGSTMQVIEQNGKNVLKFDVVAFGAGTKNIYFNVNLKKAGIETREIKRVEVWLKYQRPRGVVEILKDKETPFMGECTYLNSNGTPNETSPGGGIHPDDKNNGATVQGGVIPPTSPILNEYVVRIPTYFGNSGKEGARIEQVDFVAVADKDPDAVTEKSQLIREKDIIMPKNSGDFKDWGATTPGNSAGAIKSTKGTVTIEEVGKYPIDKSALITNGSELSVKLDGILLPKTEYTIFFSAKPLSGAKLEFRLSGYRDKSKFDYVNTGDKANQLNWMENTNIGSTGKWRDYRYDFTTGNDAGSSVLARFSAVSGNVNVDEIYIVKREDLGEITSNSKLPPNNKLSRGSRILIDQGLQYQSWASTGKDIASITDVMDMGFTSLQYMGDASYNKKLFEDAAAAGIHDLKWSTAAGPNGKHVSSTGQDEVDGRAGSPTEEEWKNGFLTPERGLNDVKNLVSMCIGDEEGYSDTLLQNLKNWFEIVREKYDKADGRTTPVLLHHNEVGAGYGYSATDSRITGNSTFTPAMLEKYVQVAKPDMITYDVYYFRERRVDQTIGGSVPQFYEDLNRYRLVAGKGLDGTGAQPIPFGQYNYSWRTGPGGGTKFNRGDGWYELTESQINLYSFATWTFGGKWMSNFSWSEQNPLYLFNQDTADVNGYYSRYKVYDWFKETIRQSKNLGPHLVRLQSNEVVIVPGNHKKSNGTIEQNVNPSNNPIWSNFKGDARNKEVFINNVEVENLGTQNSGLNGDVFISYFKQLPNLEAEDKKVFTSTDPKYFMILNGLTAGDGLPSELQQGSSYETRQEVKITFKDVPAGLKLKKVSRVNKGDIGAVVDVPLVNNQLVVTIGGGLADLYYWEVGTKTDTITVTADESGLENLMVGDMKYTNTIAKKDMGGKTITVGNIKGTEDIQPERALAKGINSPNTNLGEKDEDGFVIELEKRPNSIADITSLLGRYYRQDIWEFRLDAIQKDNNVVLKFKEYDWTKEQLLAKVNEKSEDLPDILVVPNAWMWEENNLALNNAVIPISNPENQIIDVDATKWKDSFTNMATIKNNTYGSATDPYSDGVGLVVNKPLLVNVGTESYNAAGTGIYNLQMDGKWTLEELNRIIEYAKTNNLEGKGIKLLVDNEYLLRQLFMSAGVSMDPYAFNAGSPEYKEAISIYSNLKTNNLLLPSEGLDNDLDAFKNGKVIFLAAPYTDVAKHLTSGYRYYEDNVERVVGDSGWGIQTYGAPKGGKYTATVRFEPAGKYTMGDNWNFMLFPKKDLASDYKAILNRPSYPVILSTTADKEGTALIMNRLCNTYTGTNENDVIGSGQGGVDYPINRMDPYSKATLNNGNTRDSNTLLRIAKGAGTGDNLKASGLWDEVLSAAIKTDPKAFAEINMDVKKYINKLEGNPDLPVDPIEPTDPEDSNYPEIPDPDPDPDPNPNPDPGPTPNPGSGNSSGGGSITTPPNTSNGKDSEEAKRPSFNLDTNQGIIGAINIMKDVVVKTEIIIDMQNGSGNIPKEVLAAAKGKDITMKLVQNDITAYINGKSIGTLSSRVDGYNIKISKIQEGDLSILAKEQDVFQLECSYVGKLPFIIKTKSTVGNGLTGKMLYYNYYNEDTKRFEYASVDDVDKNGILYGEIIRGGKYVITDTPGYVPKPIRKMTSNTNQTLGTNNSIKLKLNITPTDYTVKRILWKSSNTKYATVNNNGVVKATKAGKGKMVTISASALDGTKKKKIFKVYLGKTMK